MVNGILGIKVGMTQLFEKDGTAVPATVIKAGPCVVVQKKTAASDGYNAVQLGLVEFVADKRVKKPMQGHFKKANVSPAKFLKEFPLQDSAEATQVGAKVLVDQFSPSDLVDISNKLINLEQSKNKKRDVSVEKENTFLPLPKS